MVKFCIVFLMAVLAVIIPGSSGAEPAASGWFKPGQPSLKTINGDVPASLLPVYANRDCLPETRFVTIPKNVLKLRQELSHTACAVQSAFGQQSPMNGDIKLNGTDVAGPVKGADEGSRQLEIIPGSNDVMFAGGGLYGSTRYIIRDFIKNSDVRVKPDGSIFHQLKAGVIGEGIKNSSGELPAFIDTRFSDNGKWMVGEVPFVGMTRVNLETGQTLRFGPPFNHANGARPQFISAISSDGRYGVTAERRDYDIFRLYDLSDCAAECKSVDLLQSVRAQLPGLKSITHLQFSTNTSIRFYAYLVGSDGKSYNGYYLLTASGEKESSLEYMALGDSFASGEGAYNYKPGTDVRSPSSKCHLSLVSYPYLLKQKAGLNSAESVACSGAKIKDIYFSGSESEYSQSNKQSEGKEGGQYDTEIYSKFLTGYRTQLSFLEQNKPAVATVSISGNDIGFGDILLACIMPGNCYESPQERFNLFYTINSKFDETVAVFEKIKDKSGTGAKIYALGYPSLANPQGNCALNVHLSKQEIVFSNQLIEYLNATIRQAAAKAGVTYIDIEKAFLGSRLCETASSKSAVNGLTAGDDKTFSVPLKFTSRDADVYLSGRESYHPNRLGHELLSAAVASATNNLSVESPSSAPETAQPAIDDSNDVSGAAGLGLSPRKIVIDESLTGSLLFAGRQAVFKTENLLPLSSVSVYLNPGGQPAAFTVDSDGKLNAALNIPSDIKPAIYNFNVQAKNRAGEDIIVQKLVYAASSETDIDGDGTPNNQERCLLVGESGADEDKDSVDDACDGQISNPPPASLAAYSSAEYTGQPKLHVSSSLNSDLASSVPLGVSSSADSFAAPGISPALDAAEPLVLAAAADLKTEPGAAHIKVREPNKSRIKVAVAALLALVLPAWLLRNKWQKKE